MSEVSANIMEHVSCYKLFGDTSGSVIALPYVLFLRSIWSFIPRNKLSGKFFKTIMAVVVLICMQIRVTLASDLIRMSEKIKYGGMATPEVLPHPILHGNRSTFLLLRLVACFVADEEVHG